MINTFNESLKSVFIMVAEDDADDRLLIQEALEVNNVLPAQTQYVENGEELLNNLLDFSKLPSLILLDLNMPKKDGRQALKEIKNNDQLKHIPVIIFTTSNAQDDIRSSYKEGSNTFITKPSLFSDLVDTMAAIKKYWLEKAALV